jgi:hypothetical protein
LGDNIGYTFKRYKGLEGMWDSVVNEIADEFAGTMENDGVINTPHNKKAGNNTGGSKKRKKATGSSKKKTRSKSTEKDDFDSGDEDPKLNLLNRLVGNQERAALEANDVRAQINDDRLCLLTP